MSVKDHPSAGQGPRATVVFDNYRYDRRLATGWGFAAVIDGLEKAILFDTGSDGGILLSNLSALDIRPDSIDVVFLSHIDDDHTGGLMEFLDKNPSVKVYLPSSFPSSFKSSVARACAEMVEVRGATSIFDGAFTTGELEGTKTEQALVLDLGGSIAVISGCAHPGIDRLVKAAIDIAGAKDVLILGGFHFFRSDTHSIIAMIRKLRELGVRWAAPTHCSGDEGRRLFREEYDGHYIEVGIGKTIDLSGLD
ncbi:MAG: MBL fold metallo-hydrolase [Candidatus Coatesbacteria bacterium]|nr:MBL fold metallo-hydrolase [Candidatus Coatesbacteria bacterium]